MSYITPINGLATFAKVSAISIIDPLLSYPQRLVLSILALHANGKTGKSMPTQERIASLAGWFCQNKVAGTKEPNARYVSTLINNENHTKKSDRCGPGLVQYGYIKSDFKQNGFNQPNTYYLISPKFIDGYIHRPDGTKTQANFTTPAEREDTRAYKARKSAEQSEYEQKSEGPKKAKFTADDQIPLDLATTEIFKWGDDEFTRKSCEMEIMDCMDGEEQHIPDAVYRHFKMAAPATFDPGY